MVYAARIGARDLVARQRGYVARPRVMHNCFAKGAVSVSASLRVAHHSGMMVSFGVAGDTVAQRKVDFRFGSKADIAACVLDVRFTPEEADMIGSSYTSAGRSIFVFFQRKFSNCLAVLIHNGHAPVREIRSIHKHASCPKLAGDLPFAPLQAASTLGKSSSCSGRVVVLSENSTLSFGMIHIQYSQAERGRFVNP